MSRDDRTPVKTTIRVITLIKILIKFNYSYEIFTNLNRDKTTEASSVSIVENRLLNCSNAKVLIMRVMLLNTATLPELYKQ